MAPSQEALRVVTLGAKCAKSQSVVMAHRHAFHAFISQLRTEAQPGSSDWGGSMSLIAVTACGDVPVPSGV